MDELHHDSALPDAGKPSLNPEADRWQLPPIEISAPEAGVLRFEAFDREIFWRLKINDTYVSPTVNTEIVSPSRYKVDYTFGSLLRVTFHVRPGEPSVKFDLEALANIEVQFTATGSEHAKNWRSGKLRLDLSDISFDSGHRFTMAAGSRIDPAIVYEDSISDSPPLDYGTQRKVFKNPRGLGYYYLLYRDLVDGEDGTYYAYSADGSAWTVGQKVWKTQGVVHTSVTYYEDAANSRLVVYVSGDRGDHRSNPYYRRGVIPDADYLIQWDAEQEAVDVMGPARRDYNPSGYTLLGSTTLVSGATSDLTDDDGSYMVFRSYSAGTLRSPNAMISYLDGSKAPKYRHWNGGSWSSEESAGEASPSYDPRFVVMRSAPTRNEKILCVLTYYGEIWARVYDGDADSWGAWKQLASTGSYNDDTRGFDVAYEQVSGDAIIVAQVGTSDPNYWVWDGSAWTVDGGPVDLTTTTGNPRWISLASKPGSDEIAMISLDTNRDVVGIIWGGGSWGNEQLLETSSPTNTREALAVGYEQASGKAMFTWAEGPNMQSRIWDGSASAWTAEIPQVNVGGSYNLYWYSLRSDPNSNGIVLVVIDYGSDLNTVRWDGVSWTLDSEHDDRVETNGARCADAVFETAPGHSGHILLIWGDSGVDIAKYKHFDGTSWSAATPMESTAHSTDPRWVQLVRDGDGIVHLGIADDRSDLNVWTWDTRLWGWHGALEREILGGSVSYEAFMIAPDAHAGTRHVAEVEFTGTSDTNTWSQLTWLMDSAVTAVPNALVQLSLYDYSSSAYCYSGDGYIGFRAPATETDRYKLRTVAANPADYRDGSGNWMMRIKVSKQTTTQFDIKVDWAAYRPALDTAGDADYVDLEISNDGYVWMVYRKMYYPGATAYYKVPLVVSTTPYPGGSPSWSPEQDLAAGTTDYDWYPSLVPLAGSTADVGIVWAEDRDLYARYASWDGSTLTLGSTQSTTYPNIIDQGLTAVCDGNDIVHIFYDNSNAALIYETWTIATNTLTDTRTQIYDLDVDSISSTLDPSNNDIYVFYIRESDDDVAYRYSTDGGSTWSTERGVYTGKEEDVRAAHYVTEGRIGVAWSYYGPPYAIGFEAVTMVEQVTTTLTASTFTTTTMTTMETTTITERHTATAPTTAATRSITARTSSIVATTLTSTTYSPTVTLTSTSYSVSVIPLTLTATTYSPTVTRTALSTTSLTTTSLTTTALTVASIERSTTGYLSNPFVIGAIGFLSGSLPLLLFVIGRRRRRRSQGSW